MRFKKPIPVHEIAALIDAKIIGDANANATGINEIHKVEKGDLVFVDHPKYYDKCLNSAASFIIINKELPAPPGKTLLVVSNPFEAYSTIVRTHRPFMPANNMIAETAVIDESAVLCPGVFIGHHVRKIGRAHV